MGYKFVYNPISQKQDMVHTGGTASWGSISGTLSSQSDLQSALNAKQATLISAANIKTINGTSLLGSGDITISGTGDVVGPAGATTNHVVFFDGATGKLIKDSGLTLSGSNTGDQDLSVLVPKTTTVNGHALSGNVSVTTTDLGLNNVDNTSDATKNAAAVTLTNKRITKRVDGQTTTNTITPEISTYDVFVRTAQAHALVINNHSTSTPVEGDMMMFVILGDSTPRAITYGTYYVAKSGIPLPTTTVASKCTKLLFYWRNDLTQWDLVWSAQE